MCTAEVRDKQKLSAASGLGKLLVQRLSVPKLMSVYVIYDFGERQLIHGVRCPAGMFAVLHLMCLQTFQSLYFFP